MKLSVGIGVMNKSVTNKIMPLVHEVFKLVKIFKDHYYQNAFDHVLFRKKILDSLQLMEREAKEEKISVEEISHVKYALVVLLDEMVMRSGFAGGIGWMTKPLHLELFGEQVAGEGFFERLAKLREHAEKFIDVLEIYSVCLQFGFEGVYRIVGYEKLLALQAELFHQIETIRIFQEKILLDVDDSLVLPLSLMRGRKKWVMIYTLLSFVVFGVVLYATYFGFSWVMDKRTDRLIHALNAEYNRLVFNILE